MGTLTGTALSNVRFSPYASGTVTAANMRISGVAGTAFVDFSLADVLTDHLGRGIKIMDSAGVSIGGYIKAAGTGETLATTGGPLNDGNSIPNPTFDVNTTGWTAGNSTLASIAGGQSNNCFEITRVSGTLQWAYQTITSYAPAGSLVKANAYVKSGSSGDEACIVLLYASGGKQFAAVGTSSGSWVQSGSAYLTALAATQFYTKKNSDTAGTMLFDEVSAKIVLTPSATGVTIVSTPGGATYNWAFQETGFDFNDTSGHTYKITGIV